MTAIVTTKYRVEVAKLLRADLDQSLTDRNYYLFIGRSRPWTIDAVPPAPSDTVEIEFRAWDDMLALKRVKLAESSHVIPRYDWDATGDTVYFPYSDEDPDLYFHPTSADKSAGIAAVVPYTAGPIYVLTDQLHVFKCLDNNSGAKSTVRPTKPLSSPFIFEGADGYRWKYMYTLSTTQSLKFLTDAWMPVQKLDSDDGSDQWDVQQDAATTSGEITHIQVAAGGTGFVNVIDADPANPTNTFAVSATLSTITLPNSASGTNSAYNNASIWIVAGTGAGQVRTISSYVGSSRQATVSANWSVTPNGTSQIKILPSIVITGNGTGAVGQPTVVGGVIKTVKMINRGSNYTYAVAVTSGGGGSNASVLPALAPRGGHGSDAIVELGGHFLMMNTKLEYAEGSGDFPITNDYRKIGLIKNVLTPGSAIATADTLIAVKILNLTTVVGTFIPDEDIVGGTSGALAKIIEPADLGSGNGKLSFFQDTLTGFTNFTTSETITGQASGATGVLASITDREAKQQSGDLLYIEYRRPIMRAADQTEEIKLIIEA